MHSISNLKVKTLSKEAYSNIRGKDRALSRGVCRHSSEERTPTEMKRILRDLLVFHMEHSEGIYVKYGANAFWRFCEMTCYIFGKEIWNILWNIAKENAIYLTGHYYPLAHGKLSTYTTDLFPKLIEIREQAMFIHNIRKKRAEAEAVNN